jgi:hypothetical protein
MSKLRDQYLTALALVPLMLFGCSSTEESTGDIPTGSGGDRDCSQFINEADVRECEIWNEMH